MGSNGIVDYHNEYLIESPAIVIGRKGSAGQVNYIEQNCFPIDTAFYVKFKNEEVIPKYFYYLLKLIDLQKLVVGIGVPGLNRNTVYKIKIPETPKEVQEQIIKEIEILENREQKLKNSIEAMENNIQDKLNNSFNNAPKIKLSQVASLKRGRFSHRPRNAPHLYENGTYPFIQTGDVANGKGRNIQYSQYLNEEGLKVSKLFQPETILITIAANMGSTAMLTYPACFPDSIVSIKPSETMNIDYLEYYLRTQQQYLNDIAPQKAQKNINLKILEPLLVACPEKTEQDKLINEVLEIEQEIHNCEQEMSAIPQQKETILKKYL